MAEQERSWEEPRGPVTYARRFGDRYYEIPVEPSDECESAECHAPWAYVVRVLATPYAHPATRAWVGRHVCWGHAQRARLMSERYGLGLVVEQLRRDDGSVR